jgi:Family of unknown function (DUF6159)
MSIIDRLSNGWKISINSFKILKENQQLIIFPILSGISLVLIIGSFCVGIYASAGWDTDKLNEAGTVLNWILVFLFYLINYFVVVFFNMALIHCTRLYFRGEEVTVMKGLQFSWSRVGAIFSWALFAATVGTILRAIQENSGWIGRLLAGILGIVWSIATFFVIPVIAYENAGPIEAFKRSSSIMKSKWGESLGATFSFGLIKLLAGIVIAVPLFFLGSLVHPIFGIVLAVTAIFCILAIMSAAETIFVSAVYHNINDEPTQHFNNQLLENLFEKK